MSENQTRKSIIDGVLTTEAELGPKIPDGGYGWVVLIATLFFQTFVPSLLVVYGVLMASSKIYSDFEDKDMIFLWDDILTYTPLFFTTSWIFFDPVARNLISHSSWPRLVGQTGNCLICGGLLFIWMGLVVNEKSFIASRIWLILSGILTGIGSSIEISQCEILLAQYFKLKHPLLTHITQVFRLLGFAVAPIIISQLRMKCDLLEVVLFYQAILLQGLVVSFAFKKPKYLKSQLVRYEYVSEDAEEEDIFSKSVRELTVKTENAIKKIELQDMNTEGQRTSWVKFDETEDSSSKNNWETFEEEEDKNNNEKADTNTEQNVPVPLFDSSIVNMNTTYSFEEENVESDPANVPTVFPVTEKVPKINYKQYLEILGLPTFYKSLLTMITLRYSMFVFYVLFPSYFYVQITNIGFRRSAILVGCLSIVSMLLAAFSYWFQVSKKKRPMFLYALCCLGAKGYFLISTYRHNEYIVLFGALEVVLSIASLQHVRDGLMGLTIRGEPNREYVLLNFFSGLSLYLLLIIDVAYKDCFLWMALLHLITGVLWLCNFFYKLMRTAFL